MKLKRPSRTRRASRNDEIGCFMCSLPFVSVLKSGSRLWAFGINSESSTCRLSFDLSQMT